MRFATAFGLSDRMRYDLTINQFVFELYKKVLSKFMTLILETLLPCKDFARLINEVISAKNSLTSFQIFNAVETRIILQKKK